MRSFWNRTNQDRVVLHHAISVVVLLLLSCITGTHSFHLTITPSIRTFRSSHNAAAAATVQETIWQYKGHDIYTKVDTPPPDNIDTSSSSPPPPKKLPAMLLIHGFGCSTTYWRETTRVLLQKGYTVHSLDLLGQGKSAKPGRADGIEYSISLWADLVDSYARESMVGEEEGVVLVGNSLGSLVALSAATGDFAGDVMDDGIGTEQPWLNKRMKGICMFNCGVGLNSRGVAKEPRLTPTQTFLINNFYNVLVFLIFNNRLLLSYVLDKVVTKDLLRDTLRSLYKRDPARVDDELVNSFYDPAKEGGSVEALSQIYCNDPGETPFALHEKYGTGFLDELPIQVVWGDEDLVTPIEGGVGQLYLGMAEEEGKRVSFRLMEGGHVLFDDNVESNTIMLEWLDGIL